MKLEEYKKRMENEKYKALKVTKDDDGKDYVFISYRGNSWEKILTEIVYKLQKEYGLRVYFDKDFASKNNIWVEQFRDNMDSGNCKACLCFFDEGYVTSYATLLELMHASNPKSNIREHIYRIDFSIDWDKVENDGTKLEFAWEEEKGVFNYEFNIIKKNFKDIEEHYHPVYSPTLRACDCAKIMKIIQPKNKREFVDSDDFYRQFIVNPLKKDCPSVFEEDNSASFETIKNETIENVSDVKETELNITDSSITKAIPLNSSTSGNYGKGKKKNRESLTEMIKNGKIAVEDVVYVKGKPEETGNIEEDGNIRYKDKSLSLNKFVVEILGPGSRNAYLYVIHKKSGKIINDLRGE